MAYVFELTFDPDTEASIRALWQRISDAGIPSSLNARGYRPHVSLAAYDAAPFAVEVCIRRLRAYARHVQRFSINFSHVGMFVSGGNVVFLGVAPTEALL